MTTTNNSAQDYINACVAEQDAKVRVQQHKIKNHHFRLRDAHTATLNAHDLGRKLWLGFGAVLAGFGVALLVFV